MKTVVVVYENPLNYEVTLNIFHLIHMLFNTFKKEFHMQATSPLTRLEVKYHCSELNPRWWA